MIKSIKKYQFATEVHIERQGNKIFKACKKYFTFTPEEWEQLKREIKKSK